ncbi:MAG: M3 family oligoendopeptidase [Clostridia bacterium]|nr:M3 family oligoendopeptidase [Clostridia bacterium]
MNKEWSLDALYKGFDDEKFTSDMQKLDSDIAEYDKFVDNCPKTKESLVKLVNINLDIAKLSTTLMSYADLRQSVNTSDGEATAAIGKISSMLAAASGANAKFVNLVASFEDLDGVINSDALLKEHEFYLHNIKEKSKHTLSPDVESALSLYEISGSRAWSDLQGYLTSTLSVDYDGKKTNLSDIRNKAYDKDADVRRRAYDAEIAAYEKIKDSVAFSLNSLKLEVINRCKLRGYKSPLDETLENSNMKRETLDALMTAIGEYLPKFWEYLRAKAKLLGYDGALPWYDMFAPIEGNDREFTTEECRDYLVSLFAKFDKEESEMIREAFDNEWIDFFPHDGKVGGAFCADLHPIRQCRILTNYDGALGDVVTLAHELGHAFHARCLTKNSILNTDMSMQVAETASTFNEVVAMNEIIKSETDKTAKRALIESQLMDAAQIICDICSRYYFETEVFERRADEFLLSDELCKIMTNAQKRAYGNGLDEKTLHPYMWVCKSHYYIGGLSFYNFPYAFGGLFARGLYAKYLEDGEKFVPLYKELLRATGVTSVEGAAKVAGIDVSDVNFWRSSLKILSDEIDEFVKLCD